MNFKFLTSLIGATGQAIDPIYIKEMFMNTGATVAAFFGVIWNAICSGLYLIVKWLLAFTDFLQYFIQKLIGLDYWLNNSVYSIEGATKSDLLFSFLYNDTVQKVFNTMLAVFAVLLIIFTIYAIIKSEWQYVTGKNFGDGTNSKAQIITNSIKAIAMVLVFPLALTLGIISSNAILASIVKALNIDMASTFGGTLFSIGSKNANKYRIYAKSGYRTAISDQISFYVKDGVVIRFGPTDYNDGYVNQISDYGRYLAELNSGNKAVKYTVNTMFDSIDIKDGNFSGYCIGMDINDSRHYYMVKCGTSDAERRGMYYYLKNILRVDIMGDGETGDAGSRPIYNEIGRGTFSTSVGMKGFINNKDYSKSSCRELWDAFWNTWGYASIYDTKSEFETSLSYSVLSQADDDSGFLGASGKSLLSAMGLTGFTTVKKLYNSNKMSTYFDGGQFDIVQLANEYHVMADVVDFMNNNGVTLYMLDITSDMIDWKYGDYTVDSKWISLDNNRNKLNILSNSEFENTPLENTTSFVVAYSDMVSDIESGNILYSAKAGESNELNGSKFIMCYKVKDPNGTSTRYVPLVNRKEFRDPVTGNTYTFSSEYLASNYRGVVLAKGVFASKGIGSKEGNVHGLNGSPTYIAAGSQMQDGTSIDSTKPYYYQMDVSGTVTQYADTEANVLIGDETTLQIRDGISIDTAIYPGFSVANVQNVDGENYANKFKILGTDNISPEIIQSISIPLEYQTDTNNSIYCTANYAGQYVTINDGGISKTFSLFTFVYNQINYYFTIESTSESFSVCSYSSNNDEYIADENSKSLVAKTRKYKLMYDYKVGETYKEEGTNIATLTPADFTFSDNVTGNSNYHIYSTTEKQVVMGGKMQYINIYFDTKGTGRLITVSADNKIVFADPIAKNGGNDSYLYHSDEYTFTLYNYYTAEVGSKLMEYNPENGGLSDAQQSTEEGWSFTIWVSPEFTWNSQSNSYGLYNGKNYVATIYKNLGTSINSASEIASKSIRILYDGNTYYNVTTQNKYASEDQAISYYNQIKGSFITSFHRTSSVVEAFRTPSFSILPLVDFRVHFGFGTYSMNRNFETPNSFKLSDGIQFDYFFDNEDVKLQTFYVQSKISFWILIIASVLIIKVLMTALWGIIKRFYEITLYFLAMPAVASTIPLDEGNKFKSGIQEPLIKKVLSTYGVILGINVFFILLAPVRSLSQVFTEQDIAESGTYFLKYLPITAGMLNDYVYILFVLVAFTMIETLPGVISGLVGADDVHAKGKETKKQVGESMSSAANFVSGKDALEGIKKVGSTASNFIPGKNLIMAPIRGIGNKIDKGLEAVGRGFGEGYRGKQAEATSSASEAQEAGGGSSRAGNDLGGEAAEGGAAGATATAGAGNTTTAENSATAEANAPALPAVVTDDEEINEFINGENQSYVINIPKPQSRKDKIRERIKNGGKDLGFRFKKLGASTLDLLGMKDTFTRTREDGTKKSWFSQIAGMPFRMVKGAVHNITHLNEIPKKALKFMSASVGAARGLDFMHLATGYSKDMKEQMSAQGKMVPQSWLVMGAKNTPKLVKGLAHWAGNNKVATKIKDKSKEFAHWAGNNKFATGVKDKSKEFAYWAGHNKFATGVKDTSRRVKKWNQEHGLGKKIIDQRNRMEQLEEYRNKNKFNENVNDSEYVRNVYYLQTGKNISDWGKLSNKKKDKYISKIMKERINTEGTILKGASSKEADKILANTAKALLASGSNGKWAQAIKKLGEKDPAKLAELIKKDSKLFAAISKMATGNVLAAATGKKLRKGEVPPELVKEIQKGLKGDVKTMIEKLYNEFIKGKKNAVEFKKANKDTILAFLKNSPEARKIICSKMANSSYAPKIPKTDIEKVVDKKLSKMKAKEQKANMFKGAKGGAGEISDNPAITKRLAQKLADLLIISDGKIKVKN